MTQPFYLLSIFKGRKKKIPKQKKLVFFIFLFFFLLKFLMEVEVQKDRFHIEILKKAPDISDFDPLKTPNRPKPRRSMEVTVKLNPIAQDDFNASPMKSASCQFFNGENIPQSPVTSRSHDKETMSNFIATPILKKGRFSIHHEHPITDDVQPIQTETKPKIVVRRVSLDPVKPDSTETKPKKDNIFFPSSPKMVNDLIDFS